MEDKIRITIDSLLQHYFLSINNWIVNNGSIEYIKNYKEKINNIDNRLLNLYDPIIKYIKKDRVVEIEFFKNYVIINKEKIEIK